MEQQNNFRKSLQFTLKWEGGYSEIPGDRGGATKWGITQTTYDSWRASEGLSTRPVALLLAEEAATIYARNYWDAAGCDNIPYPYCTVVFDTAVNEGVSTALNFLRNAKTIEAYLELRKHRYLDIVTKKPTQQKFLRGWLNRLADLTKLVQCAAQSDES